MRQHGRLAAVHPKNRSQGNKYCSNPTKGCSRQSEGREEISSGRPGQLSCGTRFALWWMETKRRSLEARWGRCPGTNNRLFLLGCRKWLKNWRAGRRFADEHYYRWVFCAEGHMKDFSEDLFVQCIWKPLSKKLASAWRRPRNPTRNTWGFFSMWLRNPGTTSHC